MTDSWPTVDAPRRGDWRSAGRCTAAELARRVARRHGSVAAWPSCTRFVSTMPTIPTEPPCWRWPRRRWTSKTSEPGSAAERGPGVGAGRADRPADRPAAVDGLRRPCCRTGPSSCRRVGYDSWTTRCTTAPTPPTAVAAIADHDHELSPAVDPAAEQDAGSPRSAPVSPRPVPHAAADAGPGAGAVPEVQLPQVPVRHGPPRKLDPALASARDLSRLEGYLAGGDGRPRTTSSGPTCGWWCRSPVGTCGRRPGRRSR